MYPINNTSNLYSKTSKEEQTQTTAMKPPTFLKRNLTMGGSSIFRDPNFESATQTTTCGPKSWKDNVSVSDLGEDMELCEIYEGREGVFPEGFGRVYGVSSIETYASSRYDTPSSEETMPRFKETTPENPFVEEDYTITLPKTGPGNPENIILDGERGEFSTYLFSNNDPADVKYASCGNQPRLVAMSKPENKCGLCGGENCQEQAALGWKPLTGWEFCHQNCWFKLCEKYHLYNNHKFRGQPLRINSFGNWVEYLSSHGHI